MLTVKTNENSHFLFRNIKPPFILALTGE